MKKLRRIAGYGWAAACIVVVLVTFFGNDYFTAKLAAATGITVSARFTGGEIIRTADHGAYRTLIHRPVYDGLIGERGEGFIQIEWRPVTGLPPVIDEDVDFTGDGQADLAFRLDTLAGIGTLTPISPTVVALQTLVRVGQGWVARVALRKAPAG